MMLAVPRASRYFIEITFAFLLFVALLPWPTALIAEFANDASTSHPVTFLHSATMFLIAASLAGSWAHLGRSKSLLDEELSPSFQRSFRWTSMVCLPYLVAMAVALLSPLASLLIDAGVFVFLAITRSPLEQVEAGCSHLLGRLTQAHAVQCRRRCQRLDTLEARSLGR
jgi:uncharacterized membrane protein